MPILGCWTLIVTGSVFGEQVTVIPMVGTTLLTPLVGLIGAATGFYFGGQVATRASQDTMDAVKVGVGMDRDGQSEGQSATGPQ
jgi:hypothetical protein